MMPFTKTVSFTPVVTFQFGYGTRSGKAGIQSNARVSGDQVLGKAI